ncbi:MAG: hypothetical protein IPL84_13635 [Chitinophagaceae bacterium]|nr:hypothetical protein [Chitinophagaceae bacterium]
MKSSRKKIVSRVLLSLLLITVSIGFVGYKLYTKPHRNIEETKAIPVSARELARAYENDETEANAKYLDKVLEIQGEINDVSTNQKGEPVITMKGTDLSGLICTLEGKSVREIKPNKSVSIKGICTGFLTDVVLVRCILQGD